MCLTWHGDDDDQCSRGNEIKKSVLEVQQAGPVVPAHRGMPHKKQTTQRVAAWHVTERQHIHRKPRGPCTRMHRAGRQSRRPRNMRKSIHMYFYTCKTKGEKRNIEHRQPRGHNSNTVHVMILLSTASWFVHSL